MWAFRSFEMISWYCTTREFCAVIGRTLYWAVKYETVCYAVSFHVKISVNRYLKAIDRFHSGTGSLVISVVKFTQKLFIIYGSLKRRWDLYTEVVLFLVATTAVKGLINGVKRLCAKFIINGTTKLQQITVLNTNVTVNSVQTLLTSKSGVEV